MTVNTDKIVEMKELHTELQDCLEGSSKDDLAQCARLLAMYLSIYKRKFGELPSQDFYQLNLPTTDEELGTDIFIDGMLEMIDMLALISAEPMQSPNPIPLHRIIN